MEFVNYSVDSGIAVIQLSRGKVNAINEAVVDQLRAAFDRAEADATARAVVLTGQGKFFSYGFDIPEFMSLRREQFTHFLRKFTDLYTRIYVFPKPVIAALNGHAIAGGCMLALACDHRIMVSGKAKTGLNEVAFGASVFAGSVEMLAHAVGKRVAERVLLSGEMHPSEEALRLGLVDKVVAPDDVMREARMVAESLGAKAGRAFASLKLLVRGPVFQEMRRREPASIEEFLDIWYSPETQAELKTKVIRD